ncbi:MAG: SusC/RagA family TonB-linked outer membrane protein, partial [Bacteroidaceae bacterium]|nr:SusC/RagA family TonB-linked outer membrane protein [Bacteroidaceae bacterium]
MSKKHFSQLWKERALTVAVLFVLSTITMFAQKVTGVVRDASGEPLVGVNVVEKGATSNGAVTNINGEYQINVATGKTLVFSYIGFESKEATVKGNKLNVYLKEDSKLISDVVVVGYGSMQRKDLTSSVTTVKADDLNKGVFTDPAQMLQGKVPGLIVTSNGDPNGTPSIILRGTSTFRDGAMSPYYVVDGIPGVDISMVAPDDIESIDILRDATATAIYGSKAANGVILITTKSGKNGKTNVSYNAYVGFDQISNKLDMMDADGLRSLSQYGIAVDDNGGNTDWQKEVLRTGVSYNHNLSINGGSDKTKYSASVSYMDRKGIIKGTDFSRLNVRTLLTTKVLKDHLDLSVGANLVYGKHQGVAMNWHGESVIDAMNYYSPLNPIYNEDGSYYRVSVQPDKNYNPLSMINEDTGENNMKRQQFMAKATLHIIKGLDWNVNYAFNNYQRTNSTYNSHNSQVVSYKREGQSSRNTSFGHDNKFETFGNYEVKFNDIHKLTAMFGYSWEETVYGDSFGMTLDTYYPNSDESRWNGMNAMNVTNGIHGISSGNK